MFIPDGVHHGAIFDTDMEPVGLRGYVMESIPRHLSTGVCRPDKDTGILNVDYLEFKFFSEKLESIEGILNDLNKKEINMAATLEELQAAITAVSDAINQDAAQDQLVIAAIEALIAKINASPAAPDFTNEVAALGAAVGILTTSNQGIQAELDKAPK